MRTTASLLIGVMAVILMLALPGHAADDAITVVIRFTEGEVSTYYRCETTATEAQVTASVLYEGRHTFLNCDYVGAIERTTRPRTPTPVRPTLSIASVLDP